MTSTMMTSTMMTFETYTATFGSHAECASGMKKETTDKLHNPDNISLDYIHLKNMHDYAKSMNADSTLLNLKDVMGLGNDAPDAYLWYSPDFLTKCGVNPDEVLYELKKLPYMAKDKFMGKWRNRKARSNNIITDIAHRENMDMIPPLNLSIAFDSCPNLSKIRSLGAHFGDNEYANLVAEINKYSHISDTKQGIGYHGDSERKGTWAIRFGVPMFFGMKVFKNGEEIGIPYSFKIMHGGMYAMCSKACGRDWMGRKDVTFRHAAWFKDEPICKKRKR